MAKKKANNQQQTLSPEKLIIQNGRKLPIYECFISEDIRSCGLGYASVARKHTGGKITAAFYLLDVYCCGVKDTIYKARMEEYEYDEFIGEFKEHGMVKSSYEEVHNWIYGALEWADEAGIKPHKDFSVTKFLLEEDTDEIPLIEYEFGLDGKYCLVCESNIEADKYLTVMKKNLAEDQYEVIIHDDEYDDKVEDEEHLTPEATEELKRMVDEMVERMDKITHVKYAYEGGAYPQTLELENPDLMKVVEKKTARVNVKDLKMIDSLSSESLTKDFRSIILYAIGQIRNGGLDEKTELKYGEQISNVLILMGEYGDVESNLAVVLELMRQNTDLFDLALGDCGDTILQPTLYRLCQDRLSVLKDYLLEPGLYTYFKIEALTSLCKIAYYEPSKRGEVLSIAEELLDIYTEKIAENKICDGSSAAFLVSLFIDLGAKEYLPKIRKIYATNLIDEGVDGTISEVEAYLNNGEDRYYGEELIFETIKRFEEFKRWE